MRSLYARGLNSSVFVLASALGLPAWCADAGDYYQLSLEQLGQVEISIATGNSTPLDRAPATASVINAADIRAMGARDLDEVLETIPGLHVAPSSLSRLDSVYSIRGIHTGFNPQVLLLINGVPVQYSFQGGRPTRFRLPVAAIERVEVIRGPGSAIYGADAYAGVINVITKDSSSSEDDNVGVRLGSFGSYDAWLEGGTHWQDLGIAFTFGYQKSDGDSGRIVERDIQSTLDDLLGTTASLAPGALATQYEVFDSHLALNGTAWQLNLWNWVSRDAGVGAGGSQALDPLGRDQDKLWMLDFTRRLDSADGDWESNLRLSYLNYEQTTRFYLFPANSVLPLGSDGNINFTQPVNWVSFPEGVIGEPGGNGSETQGELTSIYNAWRGHRIRMALGLKQQQISPRERKNFGPGVTDGSELVLGGTLTDVSDSEFVFLPNSSRDIRYLSLQDEWQLSQSLELTTGVRYDDYSDFGGTTNPRLALVWAASSDLTAKLLYGSAFRAPSFSEQRFQNNPVSLGNPELKPEQIDTLELSFNYRARENLQTSVTFYTYKASDMIEFIQDRFATTKTAQNARDQDGKGVELEFNWKADSHLLITGNYAYQAAEDASSGAAVADAPGQQIMLAANWEFMSQWSFYPQVFWIGDRQRNSLDVRAPIADYTLVNLNLVRRNLLPRLDASLSLRNLADADAREPSSGEIPADYPLEGRSLMFELRYQLQ